MYLVLTLLSQNYLQAGCLPWKRQPWHTYYKQTECLRIETCCIIRCFVFFLRFHPPAPALTPMFWRNLRVIQQSPRITAVDTIRIIPNVKDTILRPMKMLRILRFLKRRETPGVAYGRHGVVVFDCVLYKVTQEKQVFKVLFQLITSSFKSRKSNSTS